MTQTSLSNNCEAAKTVFTYIIRTKKNCLAIFLHLTCTPYLNYTCNLTMVLNLNNICIVLIKTCFPVRTGRDNLVISNRTVCNKQVIHA